MASDVEAPPVVTIDGPSGTGKGTLALRLCRWLNWHLLDSGALYRTVAYVALERAVGLDDEDALAAIAAELPLVFADDGAELCVLLDELDVGDCIRSEVVGSAASAVAALAGVRKALLARQRAFLQMPGLVADGRDMGTVVFPSAVVKIFLTANAEVRAERRYKQLKQKGNDVNLARLSADIAARDRRDEARALSPLRPAPDAVILDTTSLDTNTVEEAARAIIQERGLG